MATRPRLRSKFGCQTCKRRKRACDEQRPVCGTCTRLCSACTWSTEPRPQQGEVTFQACLTAFETARGTLASNTDFARLFDVHVIILALTTSWSEVRATYGLDAQWSALWAVDTSIASTYSLTRRFITLWTMRVLAKVRFHHRSSPMTVFRS